jgi:D-alanyl-D-alanine carboxypeptidase
MTFHPAAAHYAAHRVSHGTHERHKHEESDTPRYADIVLDANSGKVLHADQADELRHPASLTKVMTLYLLFEKLESGALRLDSQIPVSEHASEQAPTKLGLKPGQTIEVEDAIRGLVTKSANDAAVAVAEAIGGSEHDFAEMMTAKAHALGMTRTVYHNASGLPSDEQVTTARDQAILGRAIQDRFPHYYRYFSTPSFTWQGETVRNHNHLLGRVDGMDGIKTGYTQASGFNLVASVRRDDRHIVAVVLGGTSAGARDSRMRGLIEDYIDNAAAQRTLVASAAKPDAARKAESRKAQDSRKDEARKDEARKDEARKDEARKDEARLAALVRQATTAGPMADAQRPHSADAANAATPNAATPNPTTANAPLPSETASGTYSVASASTEPIRPIHVRTLKVKMAPAQVAALAPAAGALAPAPSADVPKQEPERDVIAEAIRATAQPGNTTQGNAASGNTASGSSTTSGGPAPASVNNVLASIANPPVPPSVAHVGWMIQVGAFDDEQEARVRLSIVQTKVGQMLKHASPFTEAVSAGDKTLYRARFAGIQKDQAEAICKHLKHNDIVCMTIKN